MLHFDEDHKIAAEKHLHQASVTLGLSSFDSMRLLHIEAITFNYLLSDRAQPRAISIPFFARHKCIVLAPSQTQTRVCVLVVALEIFDPVRLVRTCVQFYTVYYCGRSTHARPRCNQARNLFLLPFFFPTYSTFSVSEYRCRWYSTLPRIA